MYFIHILLSYILPKIGRAIRVGPYIKECPSWKFFFVFYFSNIKSVISETT
tara:strand:- start:510 stop:662 length:153 start_codon:yes stop_codon:yes gene_type:complete